MSDPVFLGIDIGTSGLRGSCINPQGDELAYHRVALKPARLIDNRIEQDAGIWKQALFDVILHLSKQVGIGRISRYRHRRHFQYRITLR